MKEQLEVYDSLPEMVHSINVDGTLVYVNAEWLKIFGYVSEEEVLGKKSTEFLVPESREFAEKTILPEFFEKGYCKNVPYQFIKRNGEVMDVLLSASSLKNKDGQVNQSVALLKDVTRQNYIERQLELLEVNSQMKVDTPNPKTPIERLKEIRLKHNLSQEEMAEMISMAQRSYQRVEYGEKPITADMIIKICKKLEIDPSQFFKV